MALGFSGHPLWLARGQKQIRLAPLCPGLWQPFLAPPSVSSANLAKGSAGSCLAMNFNFAFHLLGAPRFPTQDDLHSATPSCPSQTLTQSLVGGWVAMRPTLATLCPRTPRASQVPTVPASPAKPKARQPGYTLTPGKGQGMPREGVGRAVGHPSSRAWSPEQVPGPGPVSLSLVAPQSLRPISLPACCPTLRVQTTDKPSHAKWEFNCKQF